MWVLLHTGLRNSPHMQIYPFTKVHPTPKSKKTGRCGQTDPSKATEASQHLVVDEAALGRVGQRLVQ